MTTQEPAVDFAPLAESLAELTGAELTVLQRDLGTRSLASRERLPRVARVWHALAIALAEEEDRRRDILAGLDDTKTGELITGDIGAYLDQALAHDDTEADPA